MESVKQILFSFRVKIISYNEKRGKEKIEHVGNNFWYCTPYKFGYLLYTDGNRQNQRPV